MHGDLVRARKLKNKRLIQESSRTRIFLSRHANSKSIRIYFMGDTPESSKYHTDCERTLNNSKSFQYTYVIGPRLPADTKPVDQICFDKTISDNHGWGGSAIFGQGRFNWSRKNTLFTHHCLREASACTTEASIPEDDGCENIDTQELNFNVNAVHKSRSEESNDVSGGIFLGQPPSRSSVSGDDENIFRRRSSEDLSYLGEREIDKPTIIASSSAKLKPFRQTLWSFPTQWLREKLSFPSPDLLFPGSFMGMHTYVFMATFFVLWTKLGMARTFVEHVVDTLIQVVLLTLLMTTTVVIFEANDLTTRVADIGKTWISFVMTSLTSHMEPPYNNAIENGTSYSGHRNLGGSGSIQRREDVCQGSKIPNKEEENCRQGYISPSDQSKMCGQGQKVRDEIEPVQFCEEGTMTDDGLSCHDSDLVKKNAQIKMAAIAHEVTGTGTQTDTVCAVDGEDVPIYYMKDERFSEDTKALDAEIQTELDLKKIYEETEKNKRIHARSLRSLQRKFLAIRRCCQKKVGEMKRFDMHRGDYLAKLQLQLPALQQEKSSLIAERALIEKQFADEKKKNRDLVNRMTKLNQQFSRLGQGYPSTTTPTMWRQQFKSGCPNLCRSANDQQLYAPQNTYAISQHNATKMHPRHPTLLPQSPCNTGSAHGRQLNGTHQQPNKVVQTPPQHPNVAQQPRLPIFQLLQNSILSNTGPDAPGFQQLPCHQQVSTTTKYSSLTLTNHQLSNPALLQNDQNVGINECTMDRTSLEAASNS